MQTVAVKPTDIQILDGFKDVICDLLFEGEDPSGTLYDIRIRIGEIAQFLAIEGKKINIIDGSDDIMEAGRQMFERWASGASYSIEVVRQQKLIFKTSKAK